MKSNDLLNKQINGAPEPLRSYIHDLVLSVGEGAHMVQEIYVLKEQRDHVLSYLANNRVKSTR